MDITGPTVPDRGAEGAPRKEHPDYIGRYRVENVLGQGGFGIVYLAHDSTLQRHVAIKVPHPHLVFQPEYAQLYLAEAQTVAKLDHPNIVPVHDAGSAAGFPCFVVSKYIEGGTMAQALKQGPPPLAIGLALLATVAEALHYAHSQGIVHRDVKPGNILLDRDRRPYVADFGLALTEENIGQGPRFAGTHAYMSPEQARCEGHRVNGRSDIFSLGVVFYEMLTGRRPFHAGTTAELLEQITGMEVRPPRQWNDRIPKELERICLKALAKRASERYSTASDMADEIRQFLAETSNVQASTQLDKLKVPQAASKQTPSPVPIASDGRAFKIVPKGLRSFDANDADFFLELLPGPRDRVGLPDSIRFWKNRIEAADAEETFAVGLIYGPSGCGKSSLVKAGLLPKLARSVKALYVESTCEKTEVHLLGHLRRSVVGLPHTFDLVESLAALRQGRYLQPGEKVLLVLDQFEQWLYAKRNETSTELVQALRQCDGGRVQCVVLVRDDFGMAATRFMAVLDIPIMQGNNFGTVDLFDFHHARKVLAAFGYAYDRLPENLSRCSKEQNAFLDQAVAELSQDGKIISVRLALFADIFKGKEWTPTTLKRVGGIQGVGVTFLEETFAASTAPPQYTRHQEAAQAVLKVLLPEAATEIRGHMRSRRELLQASGYASRPREFEDLLRIFVSELRLITPTDPEGDDAFGHEPQNSEPALAGDSQENERDNYYQLTHDYLVPSLRDWLTRKQKETRGGRAQLLLGDCAAIWSARPVSRLLPSLAQWLRIRLLTNAKSWTEPEQRMMRKAARYHSRRGVLAAICLLLVGIIGWECFGRWKANDLCRRALAASSSELPGIVQEMRPYRRWVDPLLHEAYAQAETNKERRKQLYSSLALLPVDPGQVDYVCECLLHGDPGEVEVTRRFLLETRSERADLFWEVVQDPGRDPDQRLRAACALAKFAPQDSRWDKIGADVVQSLIAERPFEVPRWAGLLKPVAKSLVLPLGSRLETAEGAAELALIAGIFEDFASDVPAAQDLLQQRLVEPCPQDANEKTRIAVARKQAAVGVALVLLGQDKPFLPLLEHTSDPTRRSFLIERLSSGAVPVRFLAACLDRKVEVSVRRALLLSIGQYGPDHIRPKDRDDFLPHLEMLYREDPDPGIHSVVRWMLRRWEATDTVARVDSELVSGEPVGERGWYENRYGHTMIVINRPQDYIMGDELKSQSVHIPRNFAIAAGDVTVAQFLQFRGQHLYNKDYAPTTDCPVNKVGWHDAAAYCNWLSEREGYSPALRCYEIDENGQVARVKPNYLSLPGYRLPTEAEWEYACRAHAVTRYCFGRSEDLLKRYAWLRVNSSDRSHPVGTLWPNDLGLFDVHGNLRQWTQDAYRDSDNTVKTWQDVEDSIDLQGIDNESQRVARGSTFKDDHVLATCGFRYGFRPKVSSDVIGFRVARTIK